MEYPEIYNLVTPPIRKIGSSREMQGWKKWRDKVIHSRYIRAMVIGGWDMYFPNSKTPQESMQVVREIVKEVWPDATYEQDDGDWFIYQDRDAQMRIDEFGVEDYLAGMMIYVLPHEKETTVVYEKGTLGETLAIRIKERLNEGTDTK